jgi:hypothetical protein
LKKNKTPLAENRIGGTLNKMQLSLIEQGGGQYDLRSKQSPQAIGLVKALALKPLPEPILRYQIIKYL